MIKNGMTITEVAKVSELSIEEINRIIGNDNAADVESDYKPES